MHRPEHAASQLESLRAAPIAELRTVFESRGFDVSGYSDDAIAQSLLQPDHRTLKNSDLDLIVRAVEILKKRARR